MLKRFFYACAALLMLAIAYHLGASNASAQAPGNPVVGAWLAQISGVGATSAVVTANGDVYTSGTGASWSLVGNVFGSPVPTIQTSWGALKVQSR